MSIILGIDPGSQCTGYGVIDSDADGLRYIDSGVVRLPRGELTPRLKLLGESLDALIDRYTPEFASVEEVFVARNPRSALVLGHARGTAVVTCARRDIAVSEYSARQIKQAVSGTGSATKQQVQHMVKVLLGLPGYPASDAADALAAAICHHHARHSLLQGESAHRGRYRRGRIT